MESPLSVGQIRSILTHSRDRSEKERAIEALLPLLWDRWPPARYSACCSLTTRIFLPFGMHAMEWMSFPRAFSTALRTVSGGAAMPETHEQRRTVVAETLLRMIQGWIACQWSERNGMVIPRPSFFATWPNIDMGADICEAIGRLGIYEAEKELLDIIGMFRNYVNEAQTSARLALAAVPPERLTLLWKGLKEQPLPERRVLIAAILYMNQTEAVPLLLDALNEQTALYYEEISRPIISRLGEIGDVRALPVLTQIAREGPETLRPNAQSAIRRLMKEAQGLEEVTLVRASSLSTLNRDELLRANHQTPEDVHTQELLRPGPAEEDRARP